MKAKRLVPVLLLALLAGGWYWYDQQQRTNGSLRLYGNVDIREVQLGFRVAGRLLQMNPEEGDRISAGTELARLDDTPQQEALALADAQLAQAQANLQRMRTGSRPQEIEAARARLNESEAALENARLEYQRQKELVDRELSSQRGLDNAEARRDQAIARVEAARESLDLAQEGFRAEDIAAAVAALAASQAQRDQAQTRLEDTRLLAPADGVILSRVREPGTILAAGMPVYTLSLQDVVYVRAYVAETELGRVTPGAVLEVTTDSSDRVYRGQVGFVSPRAEFTPKSVETPELRTDLVYRLRIVILEPDDQLRHGMPVTLRFTDA
jgi:HlyD family secretion protein